MAFRLTAPALLAALLAAGCSFTLPKDLVQLDDLDTCPPMSIDELAARASGFDSRTATHDLRCALGTLRAASPAAVHRTSVGARICLLLAERTDEAERRERYAAEGVRWAEIALEEGAVTDGAVHYYLALNLGLAVREHAPLAAKNMKRIESELLEAKRLAPHLDHGGPLRTLGTLYLVAPAWPEGIGDGEKALALLKQAVNQFPQHPLNHIFYAQALWDLEQEDAKDQVQQILAHARRLLELGDWGEVKKMWMREYEQVAGEVGK
jgi:tetratricopeptide (TPR) repeat protein